MELKKRGEGSDDGKSDGAPRGVDDTEKGEKPMSPAMGTEDDFFELRDEGRHEVGVDNDDEDDEDDDDDDGCDHRKGNEGAQLGTTKAAVGRCRTTRSRRSRKESRIVRQRDSSLA